MGCVYSKKNRDSTNSDSHELQQHRHSFPQKTIFDVVLHNNSRGQQDADGAPSTAMASPHLLIQQGQLEITDVNLIYHTKGRNPIIWPLRYLRKYGKGEGAESDIFSFECGRHCSTGSGVFIFRCAETEQLFALLLDTINKTSQQSSQNNSMPQSARSMPVTTSNGSFVVSSSYHNQMNAGQHSDESAREYVNVPPVASTLTSATVSYHNVPTDFVRSRSSLDKVHFTLPSGQNRTMFDTSNGNGTTSAAQSNSRSRNFFDSSTLPNRRSTVSANRSHQHQQLPYGETGPLYVNASQSFDLLDTAQKSSTIGQTNPSSSSFDNVSNSVYTNLAFPNNSLNRDTPQSQSHKSFEPPPNYIQLDLTSGGSSQANGVISNSAVTAPATVDDSIQSSNNHSSPNEERGDSPSRRSTTTSTGGVDSAFIGGSSNSLNRIPHQRRPSVSLAAAAASTLGRSPLHSRITLDTQVPLPPGFSYVKIDFERTAALTQLNHNRQLAVNGGNY